jgi:transcriptional regulator with XRE-family HTH domain
MTTAQQIGSFIKEKRTALSISPDDLADIAGVSRRTLFYIENGNANPSLETLEKILGALGLQIKIVVKDEADR